MYIEADLSEIGAPSFVAITKPDLSYTLSPVP